MNEDIWIYRNITSIGSLKQCAEYPPPITVLASVDVSMLSGLYVFSVRHIVTETQLTYITYVHCTR